MSFPLMPVAKPPLFIRGKLTQTVASITVAPSSLTINIGNPSEDRWVVFVAIGASGDAIASWAAPTVNGVAMTEIVQDGTTGGDDGQKGAIWVAKVTRGTTAVLSGTLGNFLFGQVYTLTGVRNPTTGFVTRFGSGTLTTAVPSCALGYAVDNFGSLTEISNMALYKNGNSGIGADYVTDANPMTYTTTGTRLYIIRFVAWAFDY